MGAEEATETTQSAEANDEKYNSKNKMQGARMVKDRTVTCKPNTETEEEAESEAEEDAKEKEEQEQENCRNRKPESLGGKLGEMMTPTEARTTSKETNNEDTPTKETDAETTTGTTEKKDGPQETAQEQKKREQTPETTNPQTTEEQREIGKRRGTAIIPTGIIQRAEKRQSRRNTTT